MINTADYSKTPNRARRTNIENPQGDWRPVQRAIGRGEKTKLRQQAPERRYPRSLSPENPSRVWHAVCKPHPAWRRY
jgi:hypothetical protein